MQLVASVIEVFHLSHSDQRMQTYLSIRTPLRSFSTENEQVSDFEWCLTDNAETQERGRFFLIILNLATIEVFIILLLRYSSVSESSLRL